MFIIFHLHAGVELLIDFGVVHYMEVEVLSVRLGAGFNVLCAPVDVCISCVEDYVENCRFPALYVCGNGSSVVGRLKGGLHVRRGFTIHQVMEILLDTYEDVIFVEHDLLLFEDVNFQTFEDFVLLLRQIGRDRLLVYFSPKRDRIFDFIASLADRYVYVEEDAGGYYIADVSSESVTQRFYPKDPQQLTLEVF